VTEVEADSTSESVASDPDVSPEPVKVRVAAAQTSAATVPKDVRSREGAFHTDVAIVELETIEGPTKKVLSSLIKSPLITVPQLIEEGHTPSASAKPIA